jgi:hypothetical protein
MRRYIGGEEPHVGDISRGPGQNTGREIVGLVIGLDEEGAACDMRILFPDARRAEHDSTGRVAAGPAPRSAVTAPAEWRGTYGALEPHVHLYGCVDYGASSEFCLLIPAADPLALFPPPPADGAPPAQPPAEPVPPVNPSLPA